MPPTCTARIWTDGEGHTSDEKGVETMTRCWRVECSDTPTKLELLTAVGVERFAAHPERTDLIARGHGTKPVEGSPCHWEVTWSYSNAPLELTGDVPAAASAGQQPDKNQTASGNATGRLPTVSFSRREKMIVLEKNVVTETPITNTVGEPFDPPIEVARSVLVISINYKSILIDVPHIIAFFDTINSEAWKGFAAKTLRVVDIQCKQVYETVTPEGATVPAILSMYDVTVILEHNPDTWVLKVLNRGRRKKELGYIRDEFGSPTGTVDIWVAIQDDTGQPVQEPVPLKADGTRATTPAEFHYLNIDAYKLTNFNNLLK